MAVAAFADCAIRIVLDRNRDAPGVEGEVYVHRALWRVAASVGERLLHDSVERQRHRVGQLLWRLVGAAIVAGELLHGQSSARALPIAVGVAAAATLFARRRAPGLTLVISGVLVILLVHIDPSAGVVAVLAPAVALYSLALTRGRRAQLLGAAVAVGAVIGADLLHSGRPSVPQTLGHVMLVMIPLLAAEAIRAHRSNLSLLRERLELAERNREQDAERRVEQERVRIAREAARRRRAYADRDQRPVGGRRRAPRAR